MKKGKSGIVLCFYPIAAFAAAIFNAPLIAAVLAAIAIFIEHDDWAGRQTLQAWMLSMVMAFFHSASGWTASVPVPFLAAVLSVTTTVLYVIICICGIVLSILGIIRVMKDGEANIPLLAELAYRAYGKRKPKSAVNPVPPTGFQPPYGYPQQPEQPQPPQVPQGQIPVQYQYPQPPQAPYAPPQYTPPVNPPQQVPPQGEDQSGHTSL